MNPINAFPNPVSSELFVNVNGLAGQRGQLILFNQYGQIMYEVATEQLEEEQLKLDVSKYSTGLYLLSTKLATGEEFTTKIMVVE